MKALHIGFALVILCMPVLIVMADDDCCCGPILLKGKVGFPGPQGSGAVPAVFASVYGISQNEGIGGKPFPLLLDANSVAPQGIIVDFSAQTITITATGVYRLTYTVTVTGTVSAAAAVGSFNAYLGTAAMAIPSTNIYKSFDIAANATVYSQAGTSVIVNLPAGTTFQVFMGGTVHAEVSSINDPILGPIPNVTLSIEQIA